MFISTDQEVMEHLSTLIGKPVIGMDQEWKPSMTKFESERPGLLQLSDDKQAYLIDMVALAGSQALNDVLTQIFTHPKSICLGQSFEGDLLLMKRSLKEMTFWHSVERYVDMAFLHEDIEAFKAS